MQNALPSSFERELRSAGKQRYWSATSQTYAPADVLVEYLADGWTIRSVISQEVSWRGGGRHIAVHNLELIRDNQVVAVPVLDNPIVRRLLGERQARIELLKWMMSDSLRMRSPRRDLSSKGTLEAGTRPALLRPRPIHAAMHEVKIVHPSEA